MKPVPSLDKSKKEFLTFLYFKCNKNAKPWRKTKNTYITLVQAASMPDMYSLWSIWQSMSACILLIIRSVSLTRWANLFNSSSMDLSVKTDKAILETMTKVFSTLSIACLPSRLASSNGSEALPQLM